MSNEIELSVTVELDDVHESMLNTIEDRQNIEMKDELSQFVEAGIGPEIESAIHDAYQQVQHGAQNGAQTRQAGGSTVNPSRQPQTTHEPSEPVEEDTDEPAE